MRKISKLILVVAVLALALSAFAVSASAELSATTVASIDAANFYVGELTEEQGGSLDFQGQTANVFFAQAIDVMDMQNGVSSRAIRITDWSDGSAKDFAADCAGSFGKFGIAIYNMPDGVYTANLVVNGEVVDKGAFTFVANEGVAFSVNYNWNGANNHEQWYGYATLNGKFINAPDMTVEGIELPANAVLEGWYTENGDLFDFENDVYDGNFSTLSAKWARKEDLSGNMYQTSYTDADGDGSYWAFGTSVPVDIADGSTLVTVMDITEANAPQQNYNFFWHMNSSNNDHGNETGRYWWAPYANWAYFAPWTGHWTIQNAIWKNDGTTASPASAESLTISANWDPSQIFVTNQSVKFAYTAPTETTTGSMIIYVKHIMENDSAWRELCSIKDITLDHVSRTDIVYNGFNMYKGNGSATIEFIGYESYVERIGGGIEYVPGFNVSDGSVTQVENDYVAPATWDSAKTYDYIPSVDAVIGNSIGVNIPDGEKLVMEFTIDSITDGWAVNRYMGFYVNTSSAWTTIPLSTAADTGAAGFYGNWAFDVNNYEGRDAYKIGAGEFEPGFDNFDPYTDMIGATNKDTYSPYAIKVEYDPTAGTMCFYNHIIGVDFEGEYTLVTQFNGMPSYTENVHFAWFEYVGDATNYQCVISNFNIYTTGTNNVLPVIGIAGATFTEVVA